ncbi:hypothetical protein Tco_1019292 [Tanacetum coccineum]|uniref:Uncharacterized protein n=1 Tax=Tanacetum coccineum TaxID=301880 RepID=A0ABQ5FYL9_9ASTR
MVKTNSPNLSSSTGVESSRNLFVEYEFRLENTGKRLEIFIEEKGKEEKSDEDVPDIKKGRSKSTSISIESIADHTGAKKKIFGKKSVVEPHPISIDEYNDSESDSEYTRIIKKTKVKRTTVEEESNLIWIQHKLKEKKGKMIVIEIYSETDEESSPVEKKEKIKMVLTKKYLKKKGKLVVEDSKITKKDLRKKGKMVVPIDEDEELTNEDDREYFKSKKFQFDEITAQDDVDKKTGERKKIQCDKGYINEDLVFNFLSTGLEEIEYLMLGI